MNNNMPRLDYSKIVEPAKKPAAKKAVAKKPLKKPMKKNAAKEMNDLFDDIFNTTPANVLKKETITDIIQLKKELQSETNTDSKKVVKLVDQYVALAKGTNNTDPKVAKGLRTILKQLKSALERSLNQ